MKKLHLLKSMLLLCALVVGTGMTWATDLELTFSLSSNPGGWPTTNSTTLTNYTYTLSGTDYTFALNNVKCNSGYLMLTSTAVLGLPAIENYKLTKVVASNSSSCSTATKVGISSSSSSASYISGGAIQTWSTQGSTYTYNLSSTSANTMYYLYVTNKNAQVTQLKLTYESTIIAVTGVSVSESTKNLTVGDDFDLTATIAPATATNKALTWSIVNESVSGVLSLSTTTAATTTVTAEKEGTATVRVTTTDGSFTADCDVSVASASAPHATLSTTSLAFGDVEVGQSKALTFTVTPANLTGALTIASNNAKYTVSPASIAQDVTVATEITVTAAPTDLNDDMDATISISGGGITTQNVTLSATPYQVANVTLNAANGVIQEGGVTKTSLTSRVGNSATLTAVANDGYIFDSWTIAGATPATSTNAVQEFTFTATDVMLTANFVADPKRYTTIGETEISGSTNTQTGYGTEKVIVKDGLTWIHNGWQDNTNYKMIQLRKRDHSNGVSYIKLPVFSGNIQTITCSVTGASVASKDGAAVATTLNFQATADKSADVIANSDGVSTNTITIDLSSLDTDYNTGYITVATSGTGVRIWDITVAYIPTDIAVAVTSAKYATFSDHVARDFSGSGITVYAATASATKVTFDEVTDGIVPANTGVVLYSASAVNKDIPAATSASSYDFSSNEMVGINERTQVAADGGSGKTNYILANEASGVGFYKAATSGAYLTAHRAYLSTATAAGAREFLSLDDETTGIQRVDSGQFSLGECGVARTVDSYYNLNGQRVAQPTKGLYIVGGKKVVVK